MVEVVDRFTTSEVRSVRICLVDDDQQLNHLISRVHSSDVQRRVTSV